MVEIALTAEGKAIATTLSFQEFELIMRHDLLVIRSSNSHIKIRVDIEQATWATFPSES